MRSLKNINADIEKAKAKIREQSTRLKTLEQEKLIAENSEIIAAVRGGKMNEREFAELYKRFKREETTTDKGKETVQNGKEDTKNETKNQGKEDAKDEEKN